MRENGSYEKYLESAEWKALREEKFKESGRLCFVCNSVSKIQVHHRIYRHPKSSTRLSDLIVLCDTCHRDTHKAIEFYHLKLRRVDVKNIKQVLDDFRNKIPTTCVKPKKNWKPRTNSHSVPNFRNEFRMILKHYRKSASSNTGCTIDNIKSMINELQLLVESESSRRLADCIGNFSADP